MHFDVLGLIAAAEDPARARRIDLADEHLAGFVVLPPGPRNRCRRGPGPGAEPASRPAPRHLGRALAGLDDPGHRLDQPGIVDHAHAPDPELLDQDDLAAFGIEGQHRHGLAAAPGRLPRSVRGSAPQANSRWRRR